MTSVVRGVVEVVKVVLAVVVVGTWVSHLHTPRGTISRVVRCGPV